MTFCTLVEFEWDETFGRERFTSAVGDVGGDTPEGLLSRIVGIDDKGARVIEVWRSGDDAQAFAEKKPAIPRRRPDAAAVAGDRLRGHLLHGVLTLRGRLSDSPGTLPGMDWKIELVAIPVTDVDRAKAFYVEQVGFHADHDYQVTDTLRFVQLTPPGSACSVVMGTGVTQMPPGSQKGVQVVVADVGAARQELIAHGVEASDVDVQPWGSFVTFSDPDGNTWALQQLPAWR